MPKLVPVARCFLKRRFRLTSGCHSSCCVLQTNPLSRKRCTPWFLLMWGPRSMPKFASCGNPRGAVAVPLTVAEFDNLSAMARSAGTSPNAFLGSLVEQALTNLADRPATEQSVKLTIFLSSESYTKLAMMKRQAGITYGPSSLRKCGLWLTTNTSPA
jgi:hypothetical protein